MKPLRASRRRWRAQAPTCPPPPAAPPPAAPAPSCGRPQSAAAHASARMAPAASALVSVHAFALAVLVLMTLLRQYRYHCCVSLHASSGTMPAHANAPRPHARADLREEVVPLLCARFRTELLQLLHADHAVAAQTLQRLEQSCRLRLALHRVRARPPLPSRKDPFKL
eukprot:3760146-Rhodomonas_salina.1